MKTYQPELAHADDQWRARFRSASLFHSLIMATVVGAVVASVGIALFAMSRYLQISVAHSSRCWGHWASGHSERVAAGRP
jgi:hypothetical protein